MVRESYPLNTTDSIMYAIGSTNVFATHDCSLGILQIEINADQVSKTVFTFRKELFEFTNPPLSLSNCTASFQRLMEIVLGDTFLATRQTITPIDRLSLS